MPNIMEIINELNNENGSNYKKGVLEIHKDNMLLKRVLRMAYDNVSFTYGITMLNVDKFPPEKIGMKISLDTAMASLETNLCSREVTGHAALQMVSNLLHSMDVDDAGVLRLIINRDLRINLGKTHINGIFKNLIVKPPYMRCSLPDKLDRITYPSYVQTKADGSYRSIIVDNGEVTFMARSGERDDFPVIQGKLKNLPDGVYIGELLLRRFTKAEDRLKANGLINSDTEQEDMYLLVWDFLELKEWNDKKSLRDYELRLNLLESNISGIGELEVIETEEVQNYEEAMEFYKEKVSEGLEGAVLKNKNTPFKDHTSQTQIKLKEEAVAEFRIYGFEEGKGRLQGTLGAMAYESQDSMVTGKMGGFTDEMRDYIWANREELNNSIVSVKYNGITKAKGKMTYSLMFAVFQELRPDKDEADNLEYIQNALK